MASFLLVVGDAASPTSTKEQVVHDQLEAEGHTADYITDTSYVDDPDSAVAGGYDGVWISDSIQSGSHSTMVDCPVGMVISSIYISSTAGQFGLATNTSSVSATTAYTDGTIVNDTHPIHTALGWSNGTKTLLTASRATTCCDSSELPGSATELIRTTDWSTTDEVLAWAIDTGGALTTADPSTAPARRVWHPGSHDQWHADTDGGLAFTIQALYWVAGLLDATSITDTWQLYSSAIGYVDDNTIQQGHTFKVALLDNTHTLSLASHTVRANVATDIIGSDATVTMATSASGGLTVWTAGAATWATSAGLSPNYLVLYDDTPTSPADPLVAAVELSNVQVVPASTTLRLPSGIVFKR